MNSVSTATHPGTVAATATKTTSASPYFSWRLCTWAAPVFLAGFIVFWAILGFNLPPIAPGMSIGDLQAHYAENSTRIRFAMVMSVFFAPLYFVFSAVISRVMQKIEGRADGPLPIVEQMGGVVTTVVILIGCVCWMAAAHRIDERTPEITRILHDFGWLFFDTTYMATTVQAFAVAITILCDKRSEPLLPRWLAWYSIFTGAVFLPDTLLPFFFTGPFAWNGLFNYWVGFNAYFLWIILFCIYIFKAIDRIEREEAVAA
ncbi:MAG: hypothetical protein M0P39_16270 [Rhodocyclaceae bacterium]|jgi:uncharacterized membrane protein (DUF485 family)|nr:hypothetical protein [Rhodocyclaceae bacterium]